MTRRPVALAIVAACCALALVGCSKPNAPGTGDMAAGATGKGTLDASGSAPAGTGLNGGVDSGSASAAASAPAGTGTSAMGAAPVGGNGSSNATTSTSVGNRH